MANSLLKLIIAASLLTLTCIQPAWAAVGDSQLPITLDADSSDIDRQNDRLVFRGVSISQGELGIEADEALASTLDFANSEWQFTGRVRMRMGASSIEAHSARMQFANYQLMHAVIRGEPARFIQVETDGSITEGRAGLLEYDFREGIVRLSDSAWLSEAGKEISGSVLTYSMTEERVVASSSQETGERVRILITPEGMRQLSEDGLLPGEPGESGDEETEENDQDGSGQ